MPADNKKQQKRTIQSVINELVERSNGNTQRLRILEQRSESLDTRINSLEKEMLEYKRDIKKMIQTVDVKASAIDEKTLRMENTIKEVVSHIKHLATTSDIRGLQELIDIYNPLKSNFVTKEEMERAIKEK